MTKKPRIVSVIPALDEEACIGDVVRDIRPHVDHVVVVDNGSVDRTREVAENAGALVVQESRRGYGYACLAGMARARSLQADIVLFLDADGSDLPDDAPMLLRPIAAGQADLVLGVRTRKLTERGAMTRAQRFGNWLGPALMRVTMGASYRDMPPFKACTMAALDRLELTDTGHGFTIEMLTRAHSSELRIVQVDVHCRVRLGGTSKVSGNLRAASRAAVKILSTIVRHAVKERARRAR